MFNSEGKLLDNELELAARADAAQKVAICALAAVRRLAEARGVDLGLEAYADDLEARAPLPEGRGRAIEYRGRMIAASLIRAVADL